MLVTRHVLRKGLRDLSLRVMLVGDLMRTAGGMEGTNLLTTYTTRRRANQGGDSAQDMAMLSKYQGTGAHSGGIPAQVLPLHPRSN